MKPTVVVPCGCCRALCEPEAAFFDTDLAAHVCDDCRRHLGVAKAALDAAGMPDVYRGEVADNEDAPPPPDQPETT